MKVGEKIKKERMRLGLKQKDLAEMIHFTPQALSRWENGVVEPSIEVLKMLSKIFSISFDELVGIDEEKEEKKSLSTCQCCNKPIYDKDDLHLLDDGNEILCSDCLNRRREEEKRRKKRNRSWFLASALAFILVLFDVLSFLFLPRINKAMSFETFYQNPYPYDDEKRQGKDLSRQIMEEGAVLVKNDGVLPLDESAKKVNVFGWSSTQWVYSGGGSSKLSHRTSDLLSSLDSYGIKVNQSLTRMYREFLSYRPYFDLDEEGNGDSLHSYPLDYSTLYEPSIYDERYYSDELLEECEDFSSTAIVVLSRVSGESNDCPKIQRMVSDPSSMEYRYDMSRTYLDTTEDEDALLGYVSSHYRNTICIVNSTNQMNLSFLRYYDIKACLVVSATGEDTTSSIVRILYGEVSPSGRLTDTYVYDFSFSPSYLHSGPEDTITESSSLFNTDRKHNRYLYSEGVYPSKEENVNVSLRKKQFYDYASFIDYTEGIYVGYRFYETAFFMGYYDEVKTAFGSGYDGIVQYPFGYGLSYTSFRKEIVSSSLPDGSRIDIDDVLSIKVKVTNTGTRSGKEVVELYLTCPYTPYGIEKSNVVLLDFGKTVELEPGQSELVTLSSKVYDFASYDDYDRNKNGFFGYEIEKGDYLLSVKENAHQDAEKRNVLSYHVDEDILLRNDPKTGSIVGNLFSGSSKTQISIDGSNSGQNIPFLTRSDFEASFDKEGSLSRTFPGVLRTSSCYSQDDVEKANSLLDESITTDRKNGIEVYDKDGNVTELALELGKNPQDGRWEGLLDQLEAKEMENLTLHAYKHTEAIESIHKPVTYEADGPCQISSNNKGKDAGTGFSSITVLGQTFNKELAYLYGKQLGKEAKLNGFSGIYAPGGNLHRTAFGGRNWEYFSEDPYLTGCMVSNEIKGLYTQGIYCFLKHLVGYDSETCRDGIYVWMSEQTLREIYLKPFEMAVKDLGCTGIMTGYNRLGATWSGGNKALLDGVLRKEWGFEGCIITDYVDHMGYMSMDQAIRAGTSLYMDGKTPKGQYLFDDSSNTFRKCLRNATKETLYMMFNAKAREREYINFSKGQDSVGHVKEIYFCYPFLLAFLNLAVLVVDVLFFWRLNQGWDGSKQSEGSKKGSEK